MNDESLTAKLARGEFEHRTSPLKALFYDLERRIGHLLLRKAPPPGPSPRLLNLGCGPLKYSGWINADDYAIKRSLRQSDFDPEWRLDIARPWKCQADHWDGIFCQHVLEHLHYSDAIHVLEESLRTLKPRAWLRISVPTVERVRLPGESLSTESAEQSAALQLSFITQMHHHVSAWDGPLLVRVLRDLGFDRVRVVAHGEGTDERLVKDQEAKRSESVYVEARKPERT